MKSDMSVLENNKVGEISIPLGSIREIDEFIANELRMRGVKFAYFGMGRFNIPEKDRDVMIEIKKKIERIKKNGL